MSVCCKGFGKAKGTAETNLIQTVSKKSFVGIGKPLNDITKPEYDEQGYTVGIGLIIFSGQATISYHLILVFFCIKRTCISANIVEKWSLGVATTL
jgi:hypothetical protein